MRKRAKILIAVLCAVITFAPMGLAGFAGNMPEVKAAEDPVNVTASDDSETIYYDLADGDYYLAGSSITVNGESKLSGSTLSIGGDYTITVTSTGGTTTTQNVVLYRRGDTHPDGKMDSRDMVAMKKYQCGIEISKAGTAAVELTDDVLINNSDAAMMRKLVTGEIDWLTELPQFETPVNYGSGTDTEMPIAGFTGPFLDETSTSVPSGALTDTRTDAIYSMISDMGINLIATAPNKLASGTNVESVLQSELALAEKYGLDMYVNASYLGNVESQTDDLLKQYISNFAAYSSFKGITLVDEPVGVTSGYPDITSSNLSMDAHDGLAQLLHQYSNLTGYTNLFPWWSVNGTQDSYKAYLQEYIDRYNPKQISLDYYVYGDAKSGSNASKTEYFQNLAMIREAAKNGDIPFWLVVQAGGYFTDEKTYTPTSRYYPTEGQMKWNVNTALAYGAKGITYYPLIQPFSYSKAGLFSTTYDYQRSGLIGADGNKTKWYDYAKSINTQIQAIDHVLMNSSNDGIMVTADSTAADEVGTVLSTYGQLQSVTSSGSAGALAGCFDYFGTKAFYVVNYDDTSTQTITMNFNGNYSLAVTKAADVSIVNTTNHSYSVSLTAGEGVLILVNEDSNIVDTTSIQQVIAQINALPEVVACEMPRDYTNVILAKEAYDALNTVERAQISSVVKEKLGSLVALSSSYGVVGSVTGTRGVDVTYGNMTTLNLSGATKISDDVLSENIPAAYSDVVFYVYNPTTSAVSATYGTVSVNLQASAWTKVTVSRDQFTAGNDLIFAVAVSGEWRVTDFYGKNSGDLLNRVIDAINALPALNVLKLDDKNLVAEARAMYEELSSDDKAKVDNYQTLVACETKIEALEQEAQGKLPVVIDVSEQGYGLPENIENALVMDETYGTVMTFQDASYFAIEKNQLTDAYKASRSAVLYIYNPTAEEAYLGVQLGDNGWIHRDRLTLYPGQWNRVELFDRGATHTSGESSFVDNYITANETIYFYAVDAANAASTFAGESWMATSVYGMNEYNLNNVVNDQVVYDVETNWGLGGTGTEAEVVTDEVFGKVFAFASANEFQLAADKKTTEFRFCDDVVFYLYNPTDSDVQGSFTSTGYWNYRSYVNLKANAWNRIVIANFGGTEDGQMVSDANGIYFNINLPAAADGSKWKMTNFYGTPKITDDGSSAAVEALINALPDPTTIKMPDNMKDLAAIDEAKKAYDALSSTQLMFMNAEATAKLNACLTATEGYTVVANAKTDTMLIAPDGEFSGNITKETHESAGPVFAMNITSAAVSPEPYAAGFRVEKDMSNRRIVFYAYNPTETKTQIEFYADNWTVVGANQLEPGWNKITYQFAENIATGAFFGLIAHSSAEVLPNTKWLITSFYSVSDEAYLAEQVASVELLLQGIPSADDITSLDETDKIESVQNARAAYDALGDNTSKVDASLVEKLVACEAKIEELSQVNPVEEVNALIAALPRFNELKVSDKEAVRAAETAYNVLSEADKARVVGVGKLNACIEKVNVWDALAAKTVVDMSYQTLGVDGEIALNVDDNTFGKVMTVKDATYIAVTPTVMAENPAYKTSKNIAFYIYNPTDNDIDGNYTIDWGYYGYFQLKAKSWNRIEFSDFGSAENKKIITNGETVYFYAAMTGEGWKVSSFYGLSSSAADITADDTIVVDASYQELGKDGTLNVNVDDADFGKVMSVANATYVAVTPNVMTENPTYKQSKSIAFYIYNPTDTDIDGNYTIDWGYYGYFQLKANSWNRIEIADFGAAANKQMISNGETVYFYAAFTGEGWKVSHFYSLGVPGANIVEEETDIEAEAIAAVIAQIAALPEASALQLSDKEAVVAAEEAYNALSDEAKTQVTNATKLTECVAKIAELEIEAVAIAAVNDKITALPEATVLKVSDKDAVRAAETDYIALSESAKAQVANATKLNACIAKVDVWDDLAAKTVVDASYQVLGCDGVLEVNADDNTFGKVMTVSGATYIAVTKNNKTDNAAFRESDNVAFYVYNPTDTDVDGYYTMDWGYNGQFQLKANSWNRIEIADIGADSGKQFISSDATIYFYAAMTGEGWKVSSFYGLSAGAADITADDTMVLDASYQVLGCDGVLEVNADDNTFGKVMTVSGATYIAVTKNNKTDNPAFRESDNIAFYIYNPTDADVDGNYTMDWGYYGYFRLKAKSWTRIEIADFGAAANEQMISNDDTIYFYAAFAGEGWKVSNFYGLGIPGVE